MKFFPGRQRPLFRSSTFVCLALGSGVLLFAGCGKKKPPVETSMPQAVQDTNPAASPVYIRPAATTVVTAVSGAEPDLGQMTRSLRGWIARTHRVPKDFEDFVVQANIQFPPAPAGKKFAIGKRMKVVLVSQ